MATPHNLDARAKYQPDTREDEDIQLPKLHVMNRYYFEIHGVDVIWHNVYAGEKSDFSTFRQQRDEDINSLLQMVGRHLVRGLYSIVSLNASKHSLTITCICERMLDEVLAEINPMINEHDSNEANSCGLAGNGT